MEAENRRSKGGSFLKGYPSLAAFIASDIDKSTLIFNRFDRLAARNILYMQAELAELQQELDMFDAEDSHDIESKKAARSWREFKKKGETQTIRMELVKEIRKLMKQYRELVCTPQGLVRGSLSIYR